MTRDTATSLDLRTHRKPPSASAGLSEQVRRKIDELLRLDATGRQAAWQAAYLSLDLVENEGISQKLIASELRKAKGTVSTYVRAAKVGAAARAAMLDGFEDKVGVDFAARTYREWRNLGPRDAELISLANFARERLDARSERDVRKKLTGALIRARKDVLAQRTGRTLREVGLQDRCQRDDCVKWLRNAEPASVKLLHADPPYGDYIRSKDGRLFAEHSALAGLRTDCDGQDTEGALEAACGIIRAAQRALAPDDGQGGGILLLWQTAGSLIRRPIVEAIETAGLTVKWELLVHTGAPKLGDPKTPHARNAEKLLVIQRPQDRLIRCDGGEELGHSGCVVMFEDIQAFAERWQRSNSRKLWSFAGGSPMVPTVPKEFRHRKARRESAVENGDAHFMMKHEETSLFLLGKYAMPGDRVVDLFGCSASFCIAADQYGTDWTYIESNQANFDFGVERLRQMRASTC